MPCGCWSRNERARRKIVAARVETSILLVKNPAGRTRFCTLALESVELDLLVILNDATAEGRLFVLPTYTALLELHDELASHGHVLQFWQDEKDGRR